MESNEHLWVIAEYVDQLAWGGSRMSQTRGPRSGIREMSRWSASRTKI